MLTGPGGASAVGVSDRGEGRCNSRGGDVWSWTQSHPLRVFRRFLGRSCECVAVERFGSSLGDGALPDVLVSNPDVEQPFSPIAQDQVTAPADSPDDVLLISPLVDVGTDSVPDVTRPVAPSPPVEQLFVQDRLWAPVAVPASAIDNRRETPVPRRARSWRSDLPSRSVHWGLVAHSGIRRTAVQTMTRLREIFVSAARAVAVAGGPACGCGVVSPDSSSSGSLRPGESPEVVDKSPRTTRRAYRRRRPVRVMDPPVENIPVLTIQDPLAVAGAVVLDCRPPLLPVSMDISGVDLSAGRLPAVSAGVDVLPHEHEPLFSGGGDLVGLICPELGVAPLVDPGTDLEDELPTPVSSPSPDVDKSVPLSTSSGVDLELARALLEVGVLPAMVTPIVDPEVGSSTTPAGYPVPELSGMVSVPLGVASPAGLAGGSPARNKSLLGQASPPGSVA